MDVKLVVGFNEKEIKDLLIEVAKRGVGKDVTGMSATVNLGLTDEDANGCTVKPMIAATVTFNGKAQ